MRNRFSFLLIFSILVGVLGACTSNSVRDRHPDHWWQRHSAEGKPGWEILPHEAGEGEVILSKRNELGLLSNFSATPFVLRGKRYPSVEGFWQMMLYPDPLLKGDPRAKAKGVVWKHTREQVSQMTAFKAKEAGFLGEANMEKLGIDWVSFEGRKMKYRSQIPGEHYELIVEAMNAKVEQNPEVKRVLLQTGDLVLKPDHHSEKNASPEWDYFRIYMKIREELKVRQEGAGPHP
jgi:predicted NAD-dependent protein-ADP-ribosyltransferase YbiA (DUF1768 family)